MLSRIWLRRVVSISFAVLALGLMGAAQHWDIIELASLDGVLLAKAEPDECFVEIGDQRPINEDGTCDAGTPKVNQAYVWGLTKTRGRLWGGSGPNVICLVSGTLLGTGEPNQNDSWVCEYGDGPFIPPASEGTGDWRPSEIFSYDVVTNQFIDRTPDDPMIHQTLGMRAAGASSRFVYVGGPALGDGINLFAFSAITGQYLGAKHFPEFSNIRKFLLHQGVLYAAVGNEAGGGSVLRFDEDRQSSDFPFGYSVVGLLDGDGSELAVHEGRLFVSTWPNLAGAVGLPTPGGIWMSPPIPEGGLTEEHADPSAPEPWTKRFAYSDYDPDLVTAIATGMGALASFDGYLFFGPMHVPLIGLVAHQTVAEASGYEIDVTETLLNSSRAIAIFRGRNFGTDDEEIELVYGSETLPAFNIFNPAAGWTNQPNRMGMAPLFGPSGFGNIFNNYTWGMAVYRDELYVTTMDWSFVASEFIGDIGGPIPPIEIDPDGFGADMWRFPSADEPAVLETKSGFGNFLNYGGRVLLADEAFLYIGSANPMNLRTDPDEEFHGGWELLKFLTKGEDPALAHARHAPQRSGAMRRRGGRFGPGSAGADALRTGTVTIQVSDPCDGCEVQLGTDEALEVPEPPQ